MKKINNIMFQGTGSDVGKSIVVAGFCRYLANMGYSVSPFKPQNMSNNADVTKDGGEIGRAQSLQALACRKEKTVHFNPVLLKPNSNMGSQVIVHGKSIGNYKASKYYELKTFLLEKVKHSFDKINKKNDVIIVEGAGSASEVNLRDVDIANMGFAVETNTKVVLVADIEKGGVIANIVGTYNVLDEKDKKLLKGYVINKFRGDAELFKPAIDYIYKKTGLTCYGIIPWFDNAKNFPAEDSVSIKKINSNANEKKNVNVSILCLSKISNFDDFDPLVHNKHINVTLVEKNNIIPPDTDLIIIPGTKSTLKDMQFIVDNGWDIDIKYMVRCGVKVLGICGGYQILGNKIFDPEKVEDGVEEIDGLGLLNIETVMNNEKTLKEISTKSTINGFSINGYEIHMGKSVGDDTKNCFTKIDENNYEGAMSKCGNIMGTYIHGLFNNDEFRNEFFKYIKQDVCIDEKFENMVDETLDELALFLKQHVDTEKLFFDN